MEITIKAPRGPRSGAKPAEGIQTHLDFISALLMTIAVESDNKNKKLTLEIDMNGIDKDLLMQAVLALRRCSNIAT